MSQLIESMEGIVQTLETVMEALDMGDTTDELSSSAAEAIGEVAQGQFGDDDTDKAIVVHTLRKFQASALLGHIVTELKDEFGITISIQS